MDSKKGFAQIVLVGIVTAVIALSLGGYAYFSHKPTVIQEEALNEFVNESQGARDVEYVKSSPQDVPQATGQKSEPALRKRQLNTSAQSLAGTGNTRTGNVATGGPITNNSETTGRKAGVDVVQGHPVNCYPRLGFDNYRTEQTFVVNPSDNRELYINVEYKGLYKSVDGGSTWRFSGKGLKGLPHNDDPSKPCQDLRFHLYIDPSNPKRLLAPGGSAPGRVGDGLGGLSESLDGGATWHQLFTSGMSAYTESAVIDPTDPRVVYVTTAALPQGMDGPDKGKVFVTKGVVYKTTDGGSTWEELPTGLFADLRVPGIFVDAKNSQKLRLATFGLPSGTNVDKKSTEEQWGFLETNDGGKTWAKLDATRGIGIRYLAVSPVNLDHFFLMASKDNIDKVYYSVDGTLREPSTMAVSFARYDPHDKTGMRLIGVSLYAQPNDVFESLDGGKTWNAVGTLPNGITNDHRVANIVFDPIDKNVIYINSDMARVWKSRDNGKTWHQLLSIEKLAGAY